MFVIIQPIILLEMSILNFGRKRELKMLIITLMDVFLQVDHLLQNIHQLQIFETLVAVRTKGVNADMVDYATFFT